MSLSYIYFSPKVKEPQPSVAMRLDYSYEYLFLTAWPTDGLIKKTEVLRSLAMKYKTRTLEFPGSRRTGSSRFFRGSVFGQDTLE